ncbi:MAG: ABC transporter permease subunit [Candidatus Rifleibacteriota bacterium]
MSLLNNFVNKIDDNLNPIIVKELRQVVRGRFFWGLLILFLCFQCAVLSLSIADQGMTNSSVGSDTLNFLFIFLFLGCFAFIPLHTGFRFARERSENTEELLYITTITPRAIIRGKFIASLAFILIIFSAFAPFMSMTFFLSGVDMPLMFLLLCLGLFFCAGATMMQITIGSLAHDRAIKNVLRGVALVVQLIMFSTLISFTSDMIRFGSARLFGALNPAYSIITLIVVILGAMYFLYLAAASVISPAGSNRMKPIRKFLTFFWLIGLGIAFYWAGFQHNSFEVIMIWGFLSVLIIDCMIVISVCERDTLSRRIAGELPEGNFARRLAFVYSSGAAGGIAWACLMVVATALIIFILAYLVPLTGHPGRLKDDFFAFTTGFTSYIVAYSLLGAFIRRVFLRNHLSQRNTWVLVLMVSVFFALAPLFLGIFIGADSEILMMGNPFAIGGKNRETGLMFALSLALISFVVNAKWLYFQAREYIEAGRTTK